MNAVNSCLQQNMQWWCVLGGENMPFHLPPQHAETKAKAPIVSISFSVCAMRMILSIWSNPQNPFTVWPYLSLLETRLAFMRQMLTLLLLSNEEDKCTRLQADENFWPSLWQRAEAEWGQKAFSRLHATTWCKHLQSSATTTSSEGADGETLKGCLSVSFLFSHAIPPPSWTHTAVIRRVWRGRVLSHVLKRAWGWRRMDGESWICCQSGVIVPSEGRGAGGDKQKHGIWLPKTRRPWLTEEDSSRPKESWMEEDRSISRGPSGSAVLCNIPSLNVFPVVGDLI